MVHHTSRRIIRIAAFILGSFSLAFGQATLRVNEAATRLHIEPKGPANVAMTLKLPVENLSSRTIPAHVLVELVDPKGKVSSHAEQDVTLAPASTMLKIPFPWLYTGRPYEDEDDLLWERLRYSITPRVPDTATPVKGIVSVSEITPQFFHLQVIAPGYVLAGGRSTLRVRAQQSVTYKPVAGVTVQASLDVYDDKDKQLLTSKAVTDRDGFAMLAFTLPNNLDVTGNEIDVTVTGTIGKLEETADGELRVGHPGSSSISTDKPLYQPGQTVHMRFLAFGDDHKALADQTVNFEIDDPDEHTQFAASVRTSRFGIASTDWQIPESLRLGTYQIKAEFDDDRYDHNKAVAAVQISRYELPTFAVTAKPDRGYYLPGQNADVVVRADYIFGKPVRHGHVRVVREDSREWDYREQKWNIVEAASYEGDTDDQGHYNVHLDLTADRAEFAKDNYNRFQDIHLAAYFTDASTRRTEQRRFDLRLTREPIHVYLVGESNIAVDGLPLDFFVSTHYADGSPAQCDVQIGWMTKPLKKAADSRPSPELPLRRVHTNRYGLAKVSSLKLPNANSADDTFLVLTATDSNGAVGHHGEGLNFLDFVAIHVGTDKIIYRPGDPIEVTLTANRPDLMVYVQAASDDEVIAAQPLRMRGGHAELEFSPSEKFQNDITILASAFGPESDDYAYRIPPFGSRTVLFPKSRELQLAVHPQQSTYRPGDEATVNLKVGGPQGQNVQSALGLVVVDKALEERQRTDAEFGAARGFYSFPHHWGDYRGYDGFLKKDLDKLDPARPLPVGMAEVAEVLLQSRDVGPNSFESDTDSSGLRQLIETEIRPQTQRLEAALNQHHQQTHDYPESFPALKDVLAGAGIHLEELRDPWGEPYRFEFKPERESRVLTFISSGPDKKFGSPDDLHETGLSWRYFDPQKELIQSAGKSFHTRTGGYIRDIATLKSELARQGANLDTWKDPWGHAYRYDFGVATTQYTITVTSAGPDGSFNPPEKPWGDDFALTVIDFDYASELEKKIGSAFNIVQYGEKSREFPQKMEELQKALEPAGITWDSLKDPWGRRYYATFTEEAMFSDNVTVKKVEGSGQGNPPRTEIVPVTRKTRWIYIRSAGPDGVEGTPDDFTVASFSQARFEASAYSAMAVPPRDQSVLIGSAGAISGTVRDQSGAVVPKAEATAKNLETADLYTAKSDTEGKYILRNLPAGFYQVTVDSPGFKKFIITRVPVNSSSITALDVTLSLGAVTETVQVTAASPQLDDSTSMGTVISARDVESLPTVSNITTPKLRDYFPETLFWQPEVVTDGKGRAQVKFPLAGSITTWTLKAVASTVDGEIGTAEKEIRAFQPFFIDHDPPRFLTTGDEIDLPVVLRNYLDHPIQASVEMAPQKWFTLANPAPQAANIPPSDSADTVFSFTAVAPVKQGKQRVTARSRDGSDAIERTVAVHPYGQEKVNTLSQVFLGKAEMDVQLPGEMVPGSLEASLKIYPNLNAHILESIEAIMRRPYGCGEQTISSTYPSLLYLRLAEEGDKNSVLSARALHYVQLGYTRLLSYQAETGGFTLWGRGEGEVALTAYAVRFLHDAGKYTTVDSAVTKRAVAWLLQQAQPDGRWIKYRWDNKEDLSQSAEWTAYIARTIAASGEAGNTEASKQHAARVSAAVNHALAFVEPYTSSLDEPYLIAAYALAAIDSGQEARAASALKRLRQLEHREGNTSYWTLEMNTPFYGWGYTGRLETTALVVEALEKGEAAHGRAPMADDMVSRGMLFLLKNQDGYGVWYSTQATVNVLQAIAAATAPQNNAGVSGAEPPKVEKADILIDGKPVASVELPVGNRISSPVVADLSSYLAAGTHHVELRRPAGGSSASLQLLTDYYVPWTHTAETADLHHEAGGSDALRLAVNFDKSSAKPGDVVTCTVDAERVAFRGYGMMLAEIGLPPGAEVDRASLEKAMTASGWGINQYDILPDRVVLYLRPQAGGVKFSFTFKFRYGLKAVSQSSILYDYYNPEARAEVEPVKFVVQ